MIGVRQIRFGDHSAEIAFYRDAKREQERRFPDARLLDWNYESLLIDAPGWFAAQQVAREAVRL